MLKKLTGLLSDSATYGISKVLSQAIGFFLLPLYTKYLAPADYGVIAMLAILGAIFSPLAGLGMTNAIFRRYNLSKDAQEKQRVLGVGLGSVLITSMLLLSGSVLFSEQLAVLFTGNDGHKHLVSFALITAAISTITEIPMAILRAQRKVRIVATLNTINIFFAIGLTIFFVVGLRRGVQGVIEANLIASIQALVIYIFVNLKGLRLYFDKMVWLAMAKYGLPFMPHRLLAFGMAQYGQYVTGTQLGMEQAGLYSLALRVTAPLSLIVGAIQQAWVPYKFQLHAESSDAADTFRSITSYYVAITCYLWVGVSVWGPEVVRLMTPVEFHSATLLVPFAALIPIAQGYFFMFGTGIELSDNTKPMPIISASGLISIVFASIWLVPAYGAGGAAFATSLGYLVMAIVAYRFAQSRFKIIYEWRVLLPIIILALLFIGIDMALQQLTLGFRLTLAVVFSLIYPGFLVLIFIFSEHERERMKFLLRKINPKRLLETRI